MASGVSQTPIMSLSTIRSRLPTILLLSLAVCGMQCSREESPPVVGTLRTATHEFVLHAAPEGTLYTVHDSAGREVVRLASAEELAAKHPELSEDLKSLYAGSRILDSPFRAPADPAPLFDDAEGRLLKVETGDLPPLPDLRKAGN